MKLATRFLTLLAFAAAVFTGCRPEERDIDLPSIKVGGADLQFDAETKKASVALDKDLTTLVLSVDANRAWTADINWDSDEIPWIAVTPDHGDASDTPQRVVVTVLNNAGYNRNKQVKFSINYDYKTIAFSQVGERGEEIIGTLDNPLTVAGAVKYVKSLGADVQSSSGVYVKGKISRIDDGSSFAASGTYGNATFYISDDGSECGDQFYCYRVLYLGNKKWNSKTDTDIKVGDDVIIYGYVVNYKGNTPETVQGTAFVYEHNGVNRGTDEGGGGGDEGTPTGTGTVDDPYNVSAARAAVKDLTWTANDNYEKTGTVYVKGKISRIADSGTYGQSGTFGNATFYINDDGADGAELYCYRILYLGNKKYTSGTDIKVGDEVIVCGELMNYRNNTPETVANAAYLYSLNGDTGGGTPPGPGGDAKGTGTLDDPYNPLGAANAVKGLTWTSTTDYEKTGDVYVKGKISRIASGGTFTEGGTYGNASFYISEDGAEANEFYCFRILYLGNKKFESGQTDIKVGDEVIVYGKLMNYRGNTPETVAGEAYLYSLNGKTGGDTPPPTPGGVKAVTIAEFNAAPESDTQVYELVGTIGGTINTTYGNFDLTDETGTVYVYGLTATELGYGSKNDKSYASLGLNEGDKIKIHGYRGSYGDKIEVMYAWFIEKVGGDTPPTPGEVKAVTVAQFIAAPESDSQVYELVGTIGGSINTTYGNFDLTDETGTVYVYGLTATELGYGEKNDKSYASLGLVEGDKIKIRGYRGSYGDKIEVMYAWFIEKVSGGGGGDTPGGGTVDNPYTVAQALDAVKDLKWTSNTDYESTDEVYVKGKISRIPSGGTYTEGGTYGNASFYISDDGAEANEFYCFRILYLGNKKFEEGQTDIKVGDEVVICGKLMNYKGNTPETVSGKAYLYSLNSGSGGGGDTPGGSSVSFATNSEAETWNTDTDGTYGTGYAATTQGLKVGYYKHTSTSNPVAPNANHIRVYKNSVLSIGSTGGKKIKKIVLNCAPDAGSSTYCFDMTGLEGGANASADTGAKTISWTGSASKVVLHANNGQVRIEKVTIEFE